MTMEQCFDRVLIFNHCASHVHLADIGLIKVSFVKNFHFNLSWISNILLTFIFLSDSLLSLEPNFVFFTHHSLCGGISVRKTYLINEALINLK